jgi:integrase
MCYLQERAGYYRHNPKGDYMRKRSTRGLPPGSRYTSSGRITITIPFVEGGERKRLSQNKIDPREPKSYGTPEEAMAGYLRVKAYLAERSPETATVGAFYAEWSDTDHYYWGIDGVKGRSEQTLAGYAARVHAFAEHFSDRPLATITLADVEAWLEGGGPAYTLATISTMFHDAVTRRLIPTHPFAQLANDVENSLRKQRADRRDDPPKRALIDAMLTRAQALPLGLYGWVLTGVRTGMRGGELDGMEWKYLHGNRYEIRWQWNARLQKMTGPKHGSTRDLLLPPDVMDVIERIRAERVSDRYIFTNTQGGHWTHSPRMKWWEWCKDGEPSLRQIVGGATIYQATRHYWASWAVNEAGMSPYQAALLYGHKDGGKLITEVYARPDHERAMQSALDAWERTQPVDLNAERQRRRAA